MITAMPKQGTRSFEGGEIHNFVRRLILEEDAWKKYDTAYFLKKLSLQYPVTSALHESATTELNAQLKQLREHHASRPRFTLNQSPSTSPVIARHSKVTITKEADAISQHFHVTLTQIPDLTVIVNNLLINPEKTLTQPESLKRIEYTDPPPRSLQALKKTLKEYKEAHWFWRLFRGSSRTTYVKCLEAAITAVEREQKPHPYSHILNTINQITKNIDKEFRPWWRKKNKRPPKYSYRRGFFAWLKPLSLKHRLLEWTETIDPTTFGKATEERTLKKLNDIFNDKVIVSTRFFQNTQWTDAVEKALIQRSQQPLFLLSGLLTALLAQSQHSTIAQKLYKTCLKNTLETITKINDLKQFVSISNYFLSGQLEPRDSDTPAYITAKNTLQHQLLDKVAKAYVNTLSIEQLFSLCHAPDNQLPICFSNTLKIIIKQFAQKALLDFVKNTLTDNIVASRTDILRAFSIMMSKETNAFAREPFKYLIQYLVTKGKVGQLEIKHIIRHCREIKGVHEVIGEVLRISNSEHKDSGSKAADRVMRSISPMSPIKEDLQLRETAERQLFSNVKNQLEIMLGLRFVTDTASGTANPNSIPIEHEYDQKISTTLSNKRNKAQYTPIIMSLLIDIFPIHDQPLMTKIDRFKQWTAISQLTWATQLGEQLTHHIAKMRKSLYEEISQHISDTSNADEAERRATLIQKKCATLALPTKDIDIIKLQKRVALKNPKFYQALLQADSAKALQIAINENNENPEITTHYTTTLKLTDLIFKALKKGPTNDQLSLLKEADKYLADAPWYCPPQLQSTIYLALAELDFSNSPENLTLFAKLLYAGGLESIQHQSNHLPNSTLNEQQTEQLDGIINTILQAALDSVKTQLPKVPPIRLCNDQSKSPAFYYSYQHAATHTGNTYLAKRDHTLENAAFIFTHNLKILQCRHANGLAAKDALNQLFLIFCLHYLQVGCDNVRPIFSEHVQSLAFVIQHLYRTSGATIDTMAVYQDLKNTLMNSRTEKEKAGYILQSQLNTLISTIKTNPNMPIDTLLDDIQSAMDRCKPYAEYTNTINTLAIHIKQLKYFPLFIPIALQPIEKKLNDIVEMIYQSEQDQKTMGLTHHLSDMLALIQTVNAPKNTNSLFSTKRSLTARVLHFVESATPIAFTEVEDDYDIQLAPLEISDIESITLKNAFEPTLFHTPIISTQTFTTAAQAYAAH